VEDLARYLRADELPQAFYFDLLMCPWDATAFQASVANGLAQIDAAGAVVTWTLANHDVHRAVTRFGLVRPDPGAGSTDLVAVSTRARRIHCSGVLPVSSVAELPSNNPIMPSTIERSASAAARAKMSRFSDAPSIHPSRLRDDLFVTAV